MIMPPECLSKNFEDLTMDELIAERRRLVRDIALRERQLKDKDPDTLWMDPGPDVFYQCDLEFLAEVCKLTVRKYREQRSWSEDDAESTNFRIYTASDVREIQEQAAKRLQGTGKDGKRKRRRRATSFIVKGCIDGLTVVAVFKDGKFWPYQEHPGDRRRLQMPLIVQLNWLADHVENIANYHPYKGDILAAQAAVGEVFGNEAEITYLDGTEPRLPSKPGVIY